MFVVSGLLKGNNPFLLSKTSVLATICTACKYHSQGGIFFLSLSVGTLYSHFFLAVKKSGDSEVKSGLCQAGDPRSRARPLSYSVIFEGMVCLSGKFRLT